MPLNDYTNQVTMLPINHRITWLIKVPVSYRLWNQPILHFSILMDINPFVCFDSYILIDFHRIMKLVSKTLQRQRLYFFLIFFQFKYKFRGDTSPHSCQDYKFLFCIGFNKKKTLFNSVCLHIFLQVTTHVTTINYGHVLYQK